MTSVVGFYFRSASLILTIWDDSNAALSDLFAKAPRKGHATELLKETTRFCDVLKLTVLLEAKADAQYGMNDSQLQKFYESFGFEVVEDENYSVLMERKPK